MKRTALGITLILTLFSAAFCAQIISLAEANFTPLPDLLEPIYIKNDGSVEPSTAPLQREGNNYFLTNNIDNTIEIQRSNIIIDGNGYTITKPAVNTEELMMPIGWLPGVHVFEMSNVTITNIIFDGSITGVRVENASGITVSNNTIRETRSGIVVLSSSKITISDNDIALSKQHSFATGIQFLPSNPEAPSPHHITIERNLITGNSEQVPASPPQPEEYGISGGFIDSQMIGNSLTRINGIALYYDGANNLITGNNIQNNNEGILVSSQLAANNTIYGNNFNHNSENAIVPFIRNNPVNFWDNRTIGNYWSDYEGFDMDGDGIGDSPYILETVYFDYELNEDVTVQTGKDNYPLIAPFDTSTMVPEQPESALSSNSSPEPAPSLTPFPTNYTGVTLIKTEIIIGAVIVTAVLGAGLGLLIYLIKRK